LHTYVGKKSEGLLSRVHIGVGGGRGPGHTGRLRGAWPRNPSQLYFVSICAQKAISKGVGVGG
jgi:hypothetical protein